MCQVELFVQEDHGIPHFVVVPSLFDTHFATAELLPRHSPCLMCCRFGTIASAHMEISKDYKVSHACIFPRNVMCQTHTVSLLMSILPSSMNICGHSNTITPLVFWLRLIAMSSFFNTLKVTLSASSHPVS